MRRLTVRGGGRLNADTCEQWGEGGQKLAKSCGRLLWMAPYQVLAICMYINNSAQLLMYKRARANIKEKHSAYSN